MRINALGTEFAYGDILAVVKEGVDGIVLPKIESADQLKTADWLLAQLERERLLPTGSIDLLSIVETGLGFTRLDAIVSSRTRVRRFAFGAGDFTLDLALEWSRDETELLPYRSALVLASRAANLAPPIDTVWVELKDDDGFNSSAIRSRQLGFQGKLCIHPKQIPIVNKVFSPTEVQVGNARRIVAAFVKAEASGSVSIEVDGQFVDYPIFEQARRVLAISACVA